MNLLEQLKTDFRFIEGMKACINCGVCTAICPAAQYYEYDPRMVVNIVQRKQESELEQLLKSDSIWMCGECLSCKTRCPRENVPAYIIQSLKTLSIKTGYFTESEKGRQQLALVRTIGKHILEEGYCVHIDKIDMDMFPEQGPVWEWVKENIKTLSLTVGANYHGSGSGSLRQIPQESINELKAIFKQTGGADFFELIENKSEEKAKELGLTFHKGEKDEYFYDVYESKL
ncbi:MAG: 4Fe-4S dicluster domain-containing protein [Bacteroidales bacterium]|nr:4Fe-4S dicluster domain-containing protein [Bacteroidales bacterium]